MGRAPCCDKANVKKGPWSPEEDGKLKAYIEQYGTGGNWIALPNKIGLRRCGKSCRLRWLNYLRPNIKHGGFSEEEDNIICSLYISIGSRWSIIAAQLPGRTDNDIKNYWNTRLKKKLLGNWKQSPNGHLSTVDHEYKKEPHSPSLSASAVERLKLHMKLQSCQNPFLFYKNPAFQQDPNAQIGRFDGPFVASVQPMQSNLFGSNQKPEQPENSLMSASTFEGGSSSVNKDTMPKSMDIDQMVAGLQSQHNNLPLGEMASYIGQDDRLYGSNGVKETVSTEENVIWWARDADTKSSSSISWDSASVLQPEGLFPEYVMGYDLC